ncbi:Trk system potassium transporter TrkA [Desulforhopalus sp. IMCC35007]|uniref:Trk system potassium transporter TrkA n=1 Tax=Desulforhopalus sp. IMCC35007 TaxID=2569543 RepID=UPI0010ADFD2D|nr:Trk system potassium transporter TrkA [Desulforhopalus sp. IMCC35007]TKB08453.1 Trk system potassium transporter TrkA [Desulforhopalus sp. IMCC35007]
MQIIIYGGTDLGYMIASRLYTSHDITIIDEKDRLPEKYTNLDITHVSGSGADIATLEKANSGKNNLFIACSLNDEANIVACWTIKKITDIKTVCFVSKVEIYNNLNSALHLRYQSKYDIDTIIWPEQLLTQEIFRIILVPEALDVEYFDEGQAKLFEYRIKEESPLCNKRIMDYGFPPGVLIVGITRKGILSIPMGTSEIILDDKVIFMGRGKALDLLAATLFDKINQIKTAAVIGGGNVGYFLTEQMEQAKIKVKIIELDQNRCNFLADNLKKSLVLQGDGTNLELLEEESIGSMDVVVCVTSNDEKNLLCSLLAKQLGAKRIITRTSNERNADLFERVGVDVVVSPKESAMKELLNVMQAQDVDLLALVAGGQGEVLRINVPETFTDTKVMNLNLPKSAIIGVIKRGKGIIIPNGSTTVCANDQLQIFTITEKTKSIQAVFK